MNDANLTVRPDASRTVIIDFEIACQVCRTIIDQRPTRHDGRVEFTICDDCRRKLPPSLCKAATDNLFDYALRLRTGEILYFEGASFNGGEYVTLSLSQMRSPDHQSSSSDGAELPPFERGVDVRISDIVWCADAPHGS